MTTPILTPGDLEHLISAAMDIVATYKRQATECEGTLRHHDLVTALASSAVRKMDPSHVALLFATAVYLLGIEP